MFGSKGILGEMEVQKTYGVEVSFGLRPPIRLVSPWKWLRIYGVSFTYPGFM